MVGLESPLRLGVFSRASFAIQPRPKSKVYRGEGGTQKCTTSQTESLLPQPSVQDMKTKGAPRHPLTLHTLRRQRRTRHAHGRPSCCPHTLRPANFNVAAYRNRSLLQPPPRSGVCSPSCILRKRLWHAPWLRVMRWSPPPRVCCTSPYAAPSVAGPSQEPHLRHLPCRRAARVRAHAPFHPTSSATLLLELLCAEGPPRKTGDHWLHSPDIPHFQHRHFAG